MRGAAAFVVVALIAAACGGGSGEAEPTAAATADRAADKRIANRATLTVDDFPSGWSKDAEDPRGPSACASVEEARDAASGVADGAEFRRGRGVRVESTVYVYADVSAAMDRFQSIAGPESRRCYAEGIVEKARADPDIELGQVDFTALPVERLADESARERLMIPISGQGVDVVVYADLMFVRAGRAISLGVYMSVYDPFDEDLRAELADKAANRLQDVLQA